MHLRVHLDEVFSRLKERGNFMVNWFLPIFGGGQEGSVNLHGKGIVASRDQAGESGLLFQGHRFSQANLAGVRVGSPNPTGGDFSGFPEIGKLGSLGPG